MAAPAQPAVVAKQPLVRDSDEFREEIKKDSISDFFQSDTLSDITIVNPNTKGKYQ